MAGEKVQQTGEELNKRVEAKLQQEPKDSLMRRFLETGRAVVGTPLEQTGTGLQQLAGVNRPQEFVKGLTGTVFGALGATPAGAVFNGIIGQPEVKPIAEKAFGLLDSAKTAVKSLPLIKDLPSEAKDAIDVGIDLLAFKAIHETVKAPFKTTKTIEMAHPETGEMVKVKIPVDTEGWRMFKEDLVNQVNELKKDPIGFLKKQQVGMSIKDVSSEGTPLKISSQALNSQAGAEAMAEMADAQAGKRFGVEGETVSYKSSFPDWIPEDLRKTPLLKAVQEHLMNDTVPRFKKQMELYNIVKDRIESGVKAAGEWRMSEQEAIAQADKGFKTAAQLNDELQKAQAQKSVEYNKAQEQFTKGQENIAQIQNAPKTGWIQQFRETLNPFKHMDEGTKLAWQERIKGITKANERANEEFQKLDHIPIENTKQIIDDFQAGRETPVTQEIKSTFDRLRQEAIDKGIPVKERQNYLPQVYAQEPAQITAAMAKMLKDKGLSDSMVTDYLEGKPLPTDISNRLKLSPTFSKERAFQSYAEAAQYGLTPKYQSIAQLAAHYVNELEKTVTNRNFLQTLKDSGKLIDYKAQGTKPIDVSFSAGEQLYADPKLAKTLNEYFRDENNLGLAQKFFKVGAKINKALMEINLSGGLPGTNLNFFTIGQTVKSLTAGEGKVLGRAIMSNSDAATKAWFRANQSYITDMAAEGISIGKRTGNWDNFYKTLESKEGIGGMISKATGLAEGLFNKKTFDNFMPMQVVSTFKNSFDAAIKRGLPELEARKLAAETTKVYNGIIEDWGRGKTTQDVINTLVFAPRFREGLVNMLWNSAKSVTSEIKNPAFKLNRRFVAGATVSYVIYNMLNKQLTGKYMFENEPGKEFDLKIPYGDGKFVYVALLPSVLAFPRNMASGTIATAKGDWATAGQKFGSLASIPIKIGAELASNKDYFGNPIYDAEAGVPGKLKDIAAYVGLNYNHPYVKVLANQLFSPEGKKKDLFQTISSLLELPLKFSSLSNTQKAEFYDALNKQQEQRNKQKTDVQALYDKLQTMKANGQEAQAKEILNSLSDEEYSIYQDIKTGLKTKATKAAKVEMYPQYMEIRKLKEAGNLEEATARVNAMTEEEYKIYTSLKKQFDGVNIQ